MKPQIPLIKITDVKLELHERTILDSVSWEISPGQHTAILGNNGSGKTTLLRVATGYVRANRGGTVSWLGDTQADLRELRKSIGWVSNSIAATVPRRERVGQFVISGRYAQIGLRPPIRAEETEADRQRAAELMEDMGITHLSDRRFTEISQGEQQKTLLARALMAAPLLIVLDEPCSGLDPGAREQFLERLSAVLNQADAPTLVVVTHHVEEIVPEIDQVVVMRQGQIVMRGQKSECLTIDTLGEVYGKPPEKIVTSSGRFWPVW
ncbi:MAG: ATP-binding cassette domain-containing protein [Planctomycetota bacterium]